MAERLKKGVRKHPPSPADEADARALDRAVETMIRGALSEWNHTRPLGSLNRADLRRLATDAICGWILARAEMAECDPGIKADLLSSAGVAAPI